MQNNYTYKAISNLDSEGFPAGERGGEAYVQFYRTLKEAVNFLVGQRGGGVVREAPSDNIVAVLYPATDEWQCPNCKATHPVNEGECVCVANKEAA